MIVNIRGTSGSGKSFLVSKVMASYEVRIPIYSLRPGFLGIRENRGRRPIGYLMREPAPSLMVIGHYEVPSGGCDTLRKLSRDELFDLVRESAFSNHNVVFEGLLVSNEVGRTVVLAREFPLTVLHIDIPTEECLAWINQRRRLKDPTVTDVNPDNTVAKWREIRRVMERLRAAGVPCHEGNREEMFHVASKLLGILA